MVEMITRKIRRKSRKQKKSLMHGSSQVQLDHVGVNKVLGERQLVQAKKETALKVLAVVKMASMHGRKLLLQMDRLGHRKTLLQD